MPTADQKSSLRYVAPFPLFLATEVIELPDYVSLFATM